jgi:hypothetical protein
MPRDESAPPDGLVWEKKWVGRQPDMTYGRSRDGDGTDSSVLFIPGEKGVKAHAKIRDIEDDEGEGGADPERVYVYSDSSADDDEVVAAEVLVGLVVVLAAVLAARAAAPQVRRWWKGRARPSGRSVRAWLRRAWWRRGAPAVAEHPASTEVVAVTAVDTGSEQEARAALEEYRASMTSAEARDRFVAALLAMKLSEDARAFGEEQMRVLRSAWIEDEAWVGEIESVTREQIGEGIRLMLEANPSLLDELAELAETGRENGGRVLLPVETVRAVLRPTGGGR